jgi:hypothetical protein
MSVLHLINLPKDVKKYLLKIQGEAKEKKGIGKYSLQKTIEQIVKEHKQNRKEKSRPTAAQTTS